MNDQTKAVEEYIAEQSDVARKRLKDLRKLILTTFPKAIENISYKMPSYRTKPGKRPFVYMGVSKNHIGIYALHESLTTELQKALAPHITGKGTLQFPHDKPLPLDLIKRLLLEKKSQIYPE